MMALLPEIILIVALTTLFVFDFLSKKFTHTHWPHYIVFLFGALTFLVLFLPALTPYGIAMGTGANTFSGLLDFGEVSLFFKQLVIFGFLASVMFCVRYQGKTTVKKRSFESSCLMLMAVIGALFLVSATHLLVVFITVETLSLASYILVGFDQESIKAREGMTKFFLLSVLSASLFLFGCGLLFVQVGSLSFETLNQADMNLPIIKLGNLLVIAGLLFKFASVPFHFWAPDAYQGARLPYSGFMMLLPKLAIVGGLYQYLSDMKGEGNGISLILWSVCLSFALGSVSAIGQKSFKRLLGYSSIFQSGYLLTVILLSIHTKQTELLFLWCVAYALSMACCVATACEQPEGEDDLDKLGGLSLINKASLSVGLLSLGGLPVTIGFLAKFVWVKEMISFGHYYLELTLGVIGSLILVFVYLRLLREIWRADHSSNQTTPILSYVYMIAIVLAFILAGG